MEMKAIAARWPVPHAAVQAVTAGCDGVLVCSGNYDLQAATLEALVQGGRAGGDPLQARRAGAGPSAGGQGAVPARCGRPPAATRDRRTARARLRQVVGSESHQAIAAEMAKFA